MEKEKGKKNKNTTSPHSQAILAAECVTLAVPKRSKANLLPRAFSDVQKKLSVLPPSQKPVKGFIFQCQSVFFLRCVYGCPN